MVLAPRQERARVQPHGLEQDAQHVCTCFLCSSRVISNCTITYANSSFQLCVRRAVQMVEPVLVQTFVHAQLHGLVPHAQQVCSDVSSFMCYR